MGKIIQLDDALSNKIAAGEVVERPASVVKELLENSIDAGSTVIEVDLEEAGLSKIRITDNGDGIDEEDVLIAFQRHATSKIKNENDLFRIRTLGFRGEALPSIASVSRLVMKTSTGQEGNMISIEGGKVESLEKASSRKGTDILISDLFFNTPARLKYMKTIHTELGNITDVVNRLALANPNVAFRLVHNGRKLLQTSGNGDVKQVLAAIYGLTIVKSMIPISGESLDYKISGFISMPEITRASRNYISTMINGRFIKNYALVKAIQEGYHTLLPIGRYPVVLLTIEMDPVLIDVNVHPSKMEVRLSKEQELNELVSRVIKAAFKTKELIPSGAPAQKTVKAKPEQTFMELDHLPEPKSSYPPRQTGSLEGNAASWLVNERSVELNARPFGEGLKAARAEGNVDKTQPDSKNEQTAAIDFNEVEYSQKPDSESSERLEEKQRVPVLYPIGQMHGTYILAQNDRGLYLVDQHAAQERIKYEYYREKVGEVAAELQEMLVPITLEYSADECMRINEHLDPLQEVGVFLEPFGYNSFIVRSHPQWFPHGEEQVIIEDLIEQLLSMKRVDVKKLREEAAIMMSCKASIKANRHLRQDEIQSLLDELRMTSDPFTCPHGRPIIVHFSGYELEKMFKRVM